MLKFWKKSDNRQGNLIATTSSTQCSLEPREVTRHKFCPTFQEVPPLASLEDEGLCDIEEFEASRGKSRISRTLEDVMQDKAALGYFIRYMEARNASPYILCYLDIETFKTDLQMERSKSQSPLINNRSDHDSLSVSTDCDSFTADLSSLYDYMTISEVNIPSPSESNEPTCIKDKTFDISDRLVQTALDIFKKYIALEAKLNINCSEDLRKEVMENICDSDKDNFKLCFRSIDNYLFNLMKNEYFNAFLETDFFSKHQIDVLTSGNIVLDDILYNETALFYFMEFLEQENKRILLEFWIAATNLQQQLSNQKEFFDPIEAQNDAIVLYDKYFSLQAHCPMGFSDKVRLVVEQNICGENGLDINCFHTALKIVEQVLDKHYLKSFLASQLFYKYLSELINTVQSNGYSTSLENELYSPSDCSSEKSFNTSTFLALEVPYEKKRERKSTMSIDTRELYDPDTLWKRKRVHRLSLGRVTELGKYVADFEPEPDKRGFKFKEVVKKIVSLDEEEKRKEEMAWKVAEMIVKDITSVTMNDCDKLFFV